jgi:predicted nucleic acid-binding Zn ribbon protein
VNRRAPRPLSAALAALAPSLAPPTALGRVQGVWEAAVGAAIAEHCAPIAERGGVLEVVCNEAVWTAELALMGPAIVERLTAALGRAEIVSLRVRTGSSPTLNSGD